MLPAGTLYTLAEAKEYLRATGSAKDEHLAQIAAWVVSDIEEYLDRRIVFRAPPVDVDADDVVASRTLASETVAGGAITQPVAERFLIVTPTDEDLNAKGSVTVTGTVAGVAGVTEVFDLGIGGPVHGVKPFSAISAIVTAVTGASAGDTYKIGTSLGYVEFHTPNGHPELRPLEWPVQYTVELNEDADHVYAVGTRLVEGTDFEIGQREYLRRLSSPSPFAYGYRAVKHVYSGGYFTYAKVPPRIRRVALRLGSLYFQEPEKGGVEISSWSNALGSGSRFGAAGLSTPMKRDLDTYRRYGFGSSTAERAYDTEAA